MTRDSRARRATSPRRRSHAARCALPILRLAALASLAFAGAARADEPASTHDPIATLLPTRKAHLIVAAPAGARVATGNDRETILPAPPIELPAGVHHVTISLSGYRSRKETLRIGEGETRTLVAPLAPKTRHGAILRALAVPGWGSHYMEQRASSLAIFGGAAIAAGGAILFDATMRDRIDEFEEIDARYSSAVSGADIEAIARQRDAAYDDIGEAEDLRGICLIALAGAYAVGIAEAALRFPWSGEDRRAEIGPRIDALAPGEIRMTLLSISRR